MSQNFTRILSGWHGLRLTDGDELDPRVREILKAANGGATGRDNENNAVGDKISPCAGQQQPFCFQPVTMTR